MSKDKTEEKTPTTVDDVFAQEFFELCEKHGKTISVENKLVVVDLPKDEDEIKTA